MIQAQLSPDYDAHSPGLHGPAKSAGSCLGRERCDTDVWAWVDFEGPLISGRSVILFLDTPRGIRFLPVALRPLPCVAS